MSSLAVESRYGNRLVKVGVYNPNSSTCCLETLYHF